MMERSGDVLLCCEETGAGSEYFGRYCEKLLNQLLFYILQDIQL